MSECLHDYRVAAVWCDHCWQQENQALLIVEMRRANVLKQRELDDRDYYLGWKEPEVKAVRQYVPPVRVEQPKPQPKGGMNIEPARES